MSAGVAHGEGVSIPGARVVSLFSFDGRWWAYAERDGAIWSLSETGFDSYDLALQAAEPWGCRVVVRTGAAVRRGDAMA